MGSDASLLHRYHAAARGDALWKQERETSRQAPGATITLRAGDFPGPECLWCLRMAPQNATRCHHSGELRPKWLMFQVVEGKGFEPSTSALRTPRSPN